MGPGATEARHRHVERDAPIAHGPAASRWYATVVTEPASQKNGYASMGELKTTAVTAFSAIPAVAVTSSRPAVPAEVAGAARQARTPLVSAVASTPTCRRSPTTPSSTAYLSTGCHPS